MPLRRGMPSQERLVPVVESALLFSMCEGRGVDVV